MKYLLIVALLLTGCTPTLVKPKWPEVPTDIKTKCANLHEIKPNTKKLSEVLNTVVDNYALYHECHIKVQGWTEWYEEQRKIYEEIK